MWLSKLRSFIDKIIATTNAVISTEKSYVEDNVVKTSLDCDLPRYITNDMIVLTCNTIMLEYPDIKISENWKKIWVFRWKR